jgi:hypothetical protein
MHAGLAALSWLILVVATQVAAMEAVIDVFSDNELRRSVLALADNHSTSAVLTARELEVLRMAAVHSSVEELDRLLADKAHIVISINPEARILAHSTAVVRSRERCSSLSVWLIRIRNEGFVAAPLAVRILNASTGKELKANFDERRLSGGALEYRLLQFAANSSRSIEVVAQFRAGLNPGERGGSAELPILVACSPSEPKA